MKEHSTDTRTESAAGGYVGCQKSHLFSSDTESLYHTIKLFYSTGLPHVLLHGQVQEDFFRYQSQSSWGQARATTIWPGVNIFVHSSYLAVEATSLCYMFLQLLVPILQQLLIAVVLVQVGNYKNKNCQFDNTKSLSSQPCPRINTVPTLNNRPS